MTPSPIPPCHHSGCKEPGDFAENDFLLSNPDRPVRYSCFQHWKEEREETRVVAEPKFVQPELGL